MKHFYAFVFASLLASNTLFAQVELAYWSGGNTAETSYPQAGLELHASVTSALQNYSGLLPYDDGRNVWEKETSQAAVNIATTPYLSYVLTPNEGIKYDRFVIHGIDPDSGISMQLRWSVDNFAASVGNFTKGSGYTLTSVALPDVAAVEGNVEFRIYYYGTGTGTIYHSDTGPYDAADGTPESYTSYGRCFSVWGTPNSLGVDGVSEPKFAVYPNPAQTAIQLSGLAQSADYAIYDALGAQVAFGQTSNLEKIDIQRLTGGIYFVKLDGGSAVKFIKK